jgi:hypothetical protein
MSANGAGVIVETSCSEQALHSSTREANVETEGGVEPRSGRLQPEMRSFTPSNYY